MFDLLYHTFKKLADDPQEPIDPKPLPDLLRNEIEMISQARYFASRQIDLITTYAVYEARLLILPHVESMSLEDLERAWRVRAVVLIVLDEKEIQHLIANRLPPDIPNQRRLYNSILFLNRERRFAKRCRNEMLKRVQNNPVALHTLGLVEFEDANAAKFLVGKLKKKTSDIFLPTDEREEKINALLGIRSAELRRMPYHQRLAAFGKTITSVYRDIIDELRLAQQKFEGGFVSYDEEKKYMDGSKVPMLEMLTAEHESLQTQPEEIDEGITQEQRQQLAEKASKLIRLERTLGRL